jgi:hypothetical protein
MWKANGKTTTLQFFLDSFSPKTEKLSLEEAMNLSRDSLILELESVESQPMIRRNMPLPYSWLKNRQIKKVALSSLEVELG